jgi:glycosyltransferase involved in cell wall biosynthesis
MIKMFKFLNNPTPITLQKWNEETIPFVSISCITYNQENYIRRTIEGFLMQKTTFPVEILIHDDASTDNTARIVREYEQKYPQLIKPIYQLENQHSKRDGTIGRIQKGRAKGKYYATCEGDDYWIDPLKLQKQVDFMESNPDYGLVHSYFKYVDSLGKEIKTPNIEPYKGLRSRIVDGYIFDYYLRNYPFIMTCTVCYRKSLVDPDEQTILDNGLFMSLARKSKVYCIREEMSSYRYSVGISTGNSKLVDNLVQKSILYQMYYLFKDAKHSLDYYFKNITAQRRYCVAYLKMLKLFMRGVFPISEWRKFAYIFLNHPLVIAKGLYYVIKADIR